MRGFISWKRRLLIVMLAAGLVTGGFLGVRVKAASRAIAPDATPLEVPNPVQLSTAFSKLAKQLEPSVVQVTSTIEEKPTHGMFGGDDPGELFRRFFGQDPFGGNGDEPRQHRSQRAQATGSGFIVDAHGYIMTNNHVVDGATRVQVKLHDNPTLYTAKVIGTDPELDLAVIKIDPDKSLTPVKLGNSDAVQVGDWAVAIGSPFGLEATVTAGIISAKGRNLGDPEHGLQRFLQTDAAINPGNSGGPLLNINGEVVGVNTMIATRTGAFDGVGFALPMNLAVSAYNQIIKSGKVSRGAIGIRFNANVKPELMKVYGATSGVFVDEVTPGGPADHAGIHEADVITSFNGRPVKNGDDLLSTVAETEVGKRVPVTVLRDGKTLTLTLEVGDRAKIIAGNLHPGDEENGNDSEQGAPVKFGLSVQNVTEHERESLNLKENGGVVVTGVDESSFAEDLGIRNGDVILAINRQPMNSVDDVKRIAGKLKAGDPVAFKLMRAAGPNGRGEWQTFFAAGTLPNQSK